MLLLDVAWRGRARTGLARQGLVFIYSHTRYGKMENVNVTIIGLTPLLMHNSRLANPRDKFTKALKEVTGKRKKTDADYDEMSRIEFFGGIYIDEKGHPCIPGENLESMIIEGAKKIRRGPAAKSGIICDGNFHLGYTGPKSVEALFANDNFVDIRPVGVQRSKVMRTRPIFKEWKLSFVVTYDEGIVNESEVVQFIENAGQSCGLGDYRPRFGRFRIEE